jgi:hypothetical protein
MLRSVFLQLFMKQSIKGSRRRRKIHSIRKYLLAAAGGVVVCLVVVSIWVVRELQKPLFVSPLPFIKQLQAFVSNNSTDKEQVKNRISRALQKKNIPYNSIDIIDSSLYSISLKEEGVVYISAEKDIPMQIASLQVILNRLTMEGKQFRKLDLRFSKPVITF